MIIYCKAYPPEQVAAYPAVATALATRTEQPEVVYVWTDYTVTASPFPDHEVVLAGDADPEWPAFCAETLAFNGPPAELVT